MITQINLYGRACDLSEFVPQQPYTSYIHTLSYPRHSETRSSVDHN